MGVTVHRAAPGPLVGRDAELALMTDAIDHAAGGRTHVVAVDGEAGIGKTRLAREGLRLAGVRGFRTLDSAAGRLHRDLSFAPLVAALRPLVGEPRLVDGLSDLARLFDGLRLPPLVALGDPGLERTRMFEAVRTLLERASARAPLAVLIDDVHWADHGTIALLHYVVRTLPTRRCLVLLTYRGDEAGDDLREVLGALERAETSTRLRLAGLDDTAVRELAAGMLGDRAPDALIDMLIRRTGGVPLYVRATIARLVEAGGLVRTAGQWVLSAGACTEVPALVTTLLRSRVEPLPPAARQVLDVLAVSGGAAEHVLVADVAQDVADGVSALRSADLAVEETRDGALWYRVTHPVLAEAAYDLAPLLARRRLHARLAEAVQRHRPSDVQLLAAHVRGAGNEVDPAWALDVLTAATRAQLACLAGTEARACARAALDLARRLGRAEPADELAEAYATACELDGGVEEALQAWLDAARCADARPRARRLARAATLALEMGRFANALPLLDAADQAVAAAGPCPERVDIEQARVSLAGRAGDLVALDAGRRRLATLQGTTVAARAREVELHARIDLALHTGRYADALTIGDDVLARVGGGELTPSSEVMLRPTTQARICWGDLPGARTSALEGIRAAGQIGVPARGIVHSCLLALTDLLVGDWPASRRRTIGDVDRAHRAGTARGAALAMATQAMLLVRRGQIDEAAALAAQARRLLATRATADRHVVSVVDLVDGLVASARADVTGALSAATAAIDLPSIPPLALALLGEAQAAAGDTDAAARTAARLAGLGPGAPYPAALSAWIRGLAAGARRNPQAAIGALDKLDAAVAGFARLGMPYEAAVAVLDRAAVRSAAGHDRDEIADDVTGALRTLAALEAKPQVDRARAVLRDLGRRIGPAALGHRGPDRRRLSEREQEVARLVAQGLSNAEVAERLYISPRTVTTHLQNIYRRLELPSRQALVAYVLAGSPEPPATAESAADT